MNNIWLSNVNGNSTELDPSLLVQTDPSFSSVLIGKMSAQYQRNRLFAFSKKGYFYTFVTNQSAHRVYYNNLKITRQRGTLRAMNNYYPFGLMWDNPDAMPNATYQGKEFQTNTFSDGSELALYDFGARMYDPVLGRWHCSDPMYQFDSPYNAMANNPVVNIDPDGMWSIPWGNIMSSIGGFLASIRETTTQLVGNVHYTFGIEPVYSSSTTQPLSGLGTAVGGAAMLLQAGLDGKKIQDAAGNVGRELQIRVGVNTYGAPIVRSGQLDGNNPPLVNKPIVSAEQVRDSFSKPLTDPTRGYLKAGDEYTKIVWDPNLLIGSQRGNYVQYWGQVTKAGQVLQVPHNLVYNSTGGIDQTSLTFLRNQVDALLADLPNPAAPFADLTEGPHVTITDGSYSAGSNSSQARKEGDQVEAYFKSQKLKMSIYRDNDSIVWPGAPVNVNQGSISLTVRRTFYVFPF
jgi:RHS repeat-associated protein